MATLKPKSDDDVIIYMDELTNGHGPSSPKKVPPLATTDTFDYRSDVDEESIVPVHTSIELQAKPVRLLETDNTNNPRPTHGPEIDDLEPEDRVKHNFFPGVDDGLLEPDDNDDGDDGDDRDEDHHPGVPSSPKARDIPVYPGFSPPGTPTPDMNVYQQKKTIAQGMMDLALISANANQFRYVLQSSGRHPYYYPSLAMIGLSLVLQVIVGVGLIWNSRYNVKDCDQMCKANRANNWTVIAIFLVTILNVFISSFGVVESEFYSPKIPPP